jgi:hypothetical protein
MHACVYVLETAIATVPSKLQPHRPCGFNGLIEK